MKKTAYLKPEIKRVISLEHIMEGDTITMTVDNDPFGGEFGANEYDAWEEEGIVKPGTHSVWDED